MEFYLLLPISTRVLKRGIRLYRKVNTLLDILSATHSSMTFRKLKGHLQPLFAHDALWISIRKDASLVDDEIVVAGDCSFDLPIPKIKLEILYGENEFLFTRENMDALVAKLIASSVHELTHREQIKKTRGWCLPEYNETSYLSQHHEISAFASDIAIEMWIMGETREDITTSAVQYSGLYREAFDSNSPIRRKLFSKVYRAWEELELYSDYHNINK